LFKNKTKSEQKSAIVKMSAKFLDRIFWANRNFLTEKKFLVKKTEFCVGQIALVKI